MAKIVQVQEAVRTVLSIVTLEVESCRVAVKVRILWCSVV